MEFKTTTGGVTTLALDPEEEAWLRGVAKARKQHYEVVFAEFEMLRRANPLADFDQLMPLFTGVATVNGLGSEFQDAGPRGLEDLIELEALIRNRLKSCGSLQVEALLLQALATTRQAIALTQILANLDD